MKPYNLSVMATLVVALFSLLSIAIITSDGLTGMAVKGKFIQQKLTARPDASPFLPMRFECTKNVGKHCCRQSCKDALNMKQMPPRDGFNKDFDNCVYYCYWGMRPTL